MSKSVKADGLETAVEAFNQWQGAAAINYDLDENKVWTDVFAVWNESKLYRDASEGRVFRSVRPNRHRQTAGINRLHQKGGRLLSSGLFLLRLFCKLIPKKIDKSQKRKV